MWSKEFVGTGGALAMTRSGNTNVPCEPFWWGYGPCCRVKGTKDGEAFRGREQIGSWPRKKGKEKGTEQWAYNDSYIIEDENDQLCELGWA